MQLRPSAVAYRADERRDKEPAVLEHGERPVPNHVLDVIIETVGACKSGYNVSKNPGLPVLGRSESHVIKGGAGV